MRRHIDHIRSGFRQVDPDKNDNDLPDFFFKDNSCDDPAPIVATAGLHRSNRVSNPSDRWMYGLHYLLLNVEECDNLTLYGGDSQSYIFM